uniref:Uncharacterized protein n=1 Tax=Oncorhynchus tshawytscha TaxID=74940 RepID=A0A8C8K0S2_ONCTS
MDFPFRKMTTLDNVADWHNLILKWDRLNDEGSTIANKMVNLGLTMFCDMEVMMEDQDTSNSENAFGNSSELQELLSVMDKMKGIIDLEKFQYGTGRQTPLFQTWPTSQIDETFHQFKMPCRYEAYKCDRTLKRAILQELAHTTTSQWYNSARLLLEGLLLETAH